MPEARRNSTRHFDNALGLIRSFCSLEHVVLGGLRAVFHLVVFGDEEEQRRADLRHAREHDPRRGVRVLDSHDLIVPICVGQLAVGVQEGIDYIGVLWRTGQRRSDTALELAIAERAGVLRLKQSEQRVPKTRRMQS